MLDWDDLRLFLAVARSGSFLASGRKLALNHTTLARRIAGLEAALGTRLFDRSPRGVQLTRAGAELLEHADRVEAEILAAGRGLAGQEQQVSGTVRLATPEAFVTGVAKRPVVGKLPLAPLPPALAVQVTVMPAIAGLTVT